MQCFEPGQIIVLPREGGVDDLMRIFAEREARTPFRVLYAIEDILRHYDVKPDDLFKQFGALPFVAQVPEGEELEHAEMLREMNSVQVAIPNFHVTPHRGDHHINTGAVEDTIGELRCGSASPSCGNGVKIAIIDTGIDPSLLRNPSTLYPQQYATDSPDPSRGSAPTDAAGHGTTVAYIVNAIAPAATIVSIKMMDHIGNIGGLVAAICLAEAQFKPDIYNLSLAVSCDSDICGSCGNTLNSAINADQLRYLFSLIDKREDNSGDKPLLVAAAGNNRSQVLMPASFPNVLAVGSYDTKLSDFPSYSRYKQVEPDRFILAPGGQQNRSTSMGYVPPDSYAREDKFFFGTSFSAAFVTGIAARYLCATKASPCSGMSGVRIPADMQTRQFLMDSLAANSERTLRGYSPDRFGMGLAQYRL